MMKSPRQQEPIKRTVGKKREEDVWDKLYRLNQFMATLPNESPEEHGHSIRKVVGKSWPR
jgi:hypothetical protein